jgi:hypothetical protein
VCRQLPSSADKEAYELVKNNVPKAETHPNTFAWFVLIHRFSETIRNSWAGAATAAPAKGGAKPAAAPKKEEPKKEEKPAKADDDMDLFGDDDEEDAVSISCYIYLWGVPFLLNWGAHTLFTLLSLLYLIVNLNY